MIDWAEAYAEVTLRPQISPFAQAWSQRQQDYSFKVHAFALVQLRQSSKCNSHPSPSARLEGHRVHN